MLIFTIISLVSLAILGAVLSYLALRLRSSSQGPAHGMARRFNDEEEKIRSLKSAQKLPDTASALEQVARDLWGNEVSEKLRQLRQTREKVAQARQSMAGAASGIEGSLVIPKVFRDPDPDVSLGKIFFEHGSQSQGLKQEAKIIVAASALAWILFAAAVLLRILAL